MTNLVLYRKYRPSSFKDFIGQEHVVKTITNEIKSGMISHAYLFSGHRGTGKTTLARLFAKAINCQNPNGAEPCNKCSSCLEINEGRAVDIIEIDAASNRGIDEIRSIRESIKFAPNFLKYKVLILDEAHQLSKDAANALLKILEEPPSYAIFILATTEAHKMIPTIASRCQRFDFYKLSYDKVIEKLSLICKKEKVEIEKEALKMIASASEGSMRDAEGILNQVLSFLPDKKIKGEDIEALLGLVKNSIIINLVEFLIEKDKAGALKFLGEQIEKSIDILELTSSLIDYLRKLIILKIDSSLITSVMPGETKESIKKAEEQAKRFEESTLKKTIELFLEAENKSKYASIQQLPLELAIIESIGMQ
ncbi:MAG: DNA polymerase III subunit gamma/tau [Candidatus Pacebacteria bacterium]|nr:DNA polymerase III subunit gamma/tau [Candidatus Paceibacterota bacterium]MDD4074406.1 DNA polymerase III subunit gamma/tau [Candidatus Paceibacterota bacterium]